MGDVEIRRVPFGDRLAQLMVTAAIAELTVRYGGDGDETPLAHTDFDPPQGAFLVALLAGAPIGCAGWRSHGEDGLVAELKRMYTAPQARGRGIARRVLAAVEDSARAYGRKRLILEMGDRQPEALALYLSAGYGKIENFGYYREYPGVLSLARDL